MSVRSELISQHGRNRRHSRTEKSQANRLEVESLERRELLATTPQVLVTYTGQPDLSVVTGLGDLNGDGLADVVLSRAADGTVSAYSGQQDYRLRAYLGVTYGSDLASIGDVNGDGVSELLISVRAPWIPGGGRIFKLSGASGGFLMFRDGFSDQVAGVGDLNRDGYPDYLVGLEV